MGNEQEHILPDYESFFDILAQKYGKKENYSYDEADQCVREFSYKDNEWLYETFIYYILEFKAGDYYRYEDPVKFFANIIDLLEKYADILDSDYYYAVLAFCKGDNNKCIECLSKQIHDNNCEDEPYDEFDIAVDYLAVFKNGFPGFWVRLAEICKDVSCVSYLQELLIAINDFYESNDGELVKDELIAVGRNIPDGFLVNELLGLCYAEDKMWKNAAAYYSLVDERAVLFYDTLYFNTAFAASKCKDHAKAIKFYELCIDVNKYYPYAMNNYGFELYISRRYEDAKRIFEELLNDEDLQKVNGLSYIVNNYSRVLLALKLYAEAKAFAVKSPRKVGKDILDRIERYNNLESHNACDVCVNDEEGEDAPEEVKRVGAKHKQFSTEKLLEDELEARLLKWNTMFGPKLRMYDRENDLYGRQYVIPVGRLDLLCEDDKGNYWIIELKKDSGYDDAFAQTLDYIKWFEENKAKDGQKVFGIICLNGPEKELIDKVKKEPRIRLFEYSITYSEVK